MSVMGVLRGAAKVAGAGFEGYGVDRQIRLKEAMARQQSEREAERDRVLNILTQAQTKAAGERLPTPPQRVYDPKRGVVVDELTGSFASLEGLPAMPEEPQNPLVGSVAWKDAERFKAGLNPRQPPQPRSPVRWDTIKPGIDETWKPYQVNPETGETRQLRPAGGSAPATPPPPPVAAAKPILNQAQYDAGIAQGRTHAEIAEHYTVPATVRRKP